MDNSSFEARLESIGLNVSHDTKANYNKTWLTMASLLSGAYVGEHLDLSGSLGTPGQQARNLQALVNRAPVLDYLRSRRYRVVSIPSPVKTTDVTTHAQVLAAEGLNSLEASLLSTSLASRIAPTTVVDLLTDDLRASIDRQFELLAQVSTPPADDPRLVLMHVLSPHPPFVLGQNPDYLDGCFPVCSFWSTTVAETRLSSDAYAERMSKQVRALNERVAEAVQRIVQVNPEAIVMVLSDHGARHELSDLDEHFRAFFAARTPGKPDTYDGALSLTNVFRRLISTYFREDLPDLPYAAWASDWSQPLRLEPYE